LDYNSIPEKIILSNVTGVMILSNVVAKDDYFPKVLITIPSRSVAEFDLMKRWELEIALVKLGVVPNIDIPTEKGYGNAIRNSWLKKPGFDCYVTLDNDFAMPVKYISRLILPVLMGGYDVMIGSRFMPGATTDRGVMRGMVSKSYSLMLAKLFRIPLHEFFCGFRAFSPEFVKWALPETREKHWLWQPECIIVADRVDLRVGEVPIFWSDKARPTPLKRYPRDFAEIVPGTLRLFREWG
jgi:hypothetical protein